MVETKEGCVLNVTVRLHSREFRVKVEGEVLIVFCKEEPVKGRVNREIVKQLSKLFHKQVELVSGFSSREKRILVRNVNRTMIEELLKRF